MKKKPVLLRIAVPLLFFTLLCGFVALKSGYFEEKTEQSQNIEFETEETDTLPKTDSLPRRVYMSSSKSMPVVGPKKPLTEPTATEFQTQEKKRFFKTGTPIKTDSIQKISQSTPNIDSMIVLPDSVPLKEKTFFSSSKSMMMIDMPVIKMDMSQFVIDPKKVKKKKNKKRTTKRS
jgi:glutaredoxin-related protein